MVQAAYNAKHCHTNEWSVGLSTARPFLPFHPPSPAIFKLTNNGSLILTLGFSSFNFCEFLGIARLHHEGVTA